LQGTGDVLLSDNVGEFLWTIFARQDGVAHEPEETIIRDGGGIGSPFAPQLRSGCLLKRNSKR
jgi:hypothetical protein